MIRTHWIAFITLSISLLLPRTTSYACYFGDDWDFYRFYTPELSQLRGYEPFHYTFDRLYSYEPLSEDGRRRDNIDEWHAYFDKVPDKEEMAHVIYKITREQIDELKYYADGSGGISHALEGNSLAEYWKSGKGLEAIPYLEYAKRCEPHVYLEDEWSWDPVRPAYAAVADLIREGQRAYEASSDRWMQLRYAYQFIRLLHYSGRHQDVETAWEKYAAPLKDVNSIMYYWAMGHYAGALRSMQREAEAAYYFSRVFDECPSKRVQSWYSWRIQSDAIWAQTMGMCKNGREKATLHFLRALDPNAISADEIREMQSLDPGSELADLLIVREVNKLEEVLMGTPFWGKHDFRDRLANAENANTRSWLNETMGLVDETVSRKEMHDEALWLLAGAHLHYLNGDYAQASSMLSEAVNKGNRITAKHAEMLGIVHRITAATTIDAAFEDEIEAAINALKPRLSDPKFKELQNFRDDAFARYYEQNDAPEKALLARNRVYSLRENCTVKQVNKLLKFERKPGKSSYEKVLMERLKNTLSHDDLVEIKGTRLLAKNLLPEAIRVFRTLPEPYRRDQMHFQIGPDPFASNINDLINCEVRHCNVNKYNKLTLALAMQQLEKQAISDPGSAGKYHHLLGNAWYNISYFGPCWMATDYGRSGGSWYSLGESWGDWEFDINTFPENVEMKLARSHYKKSAAKSTDPEMAAFSTFMAAKCEQNQYYMEARSEDKEPYRSHFRELINNYSQTAIYDQLIKECGYFRYYVGR